MAQRARRILIDGTMARGGGGFTYLVNILPQLAALAPQHQFCVLLRNDRLARSLPALTNVEVELRPEANWAQRLLFPFGELPRFARAWSADLCFSAGETAPPRLACPTIASFRNPIVYTRLDLGASVKQVWRLRALRALSRLSARTCDRILFVSADSARWIGDSLGVPGSKRVVVHHGIDAEAWAPDACEPAADARSDILSVSSIYRHKNFARLIEAYASIARRRDDLGDLVVVGDVQQADVAAQLERTRRGLGMELAERIHLVGEVPYADMRHYYARAQLFVFPSYLETFGHPLLEAMAMGVPTVAADIPVFREIGGEAAIYADPRKTESLAGAMQEAMSTPTRELLIERARARVARFGWRDSARRLLAVFEDVWRERESVAA